MTNSGAIQILPVSRSLNLQIDALALFERLCGQQPHTLLLQSADTSATRGKKSLIVARSALHITCRNRLVEINALNANGETLIPWLERKLREGADVTRKGINIEAYYAPPSSGTDEERLAANSPLDVLRGLRQIARLPFAGNSKQDWALSPIFAGTFAYDLISSFESLPEPKFDLTNWPDFELWFPDQLIWVDHHHNACTVVCHAAGGRDSVHNYNDATTALAAHVATIAELSTQAGTETPPNSTYLAPNKPIADVDLKDAEFAQLVENLKHHIVAGDVFQIVPSRTFTVPCNQPLLAFRHLVSHNPSPYMFFINGSQGILFGASPETAVSVNGHSGRMTITPIAGTRPRGLRTDGTIDSDLDSRLEVELLLNEKEVAEHIMLVDLARNDVARVCIPGSRQVDRLLQVERYSHVMHLVSHVSGTLKPKLDALHAYTASMNMGTLVGAPKLKAAEILLQKESSRRGPYGGAVGYFNFQGDLDTAIIIRSAVVQAGKASVRAGAGVVHDSNPQAEAEETQRKAEAVLAALRRAHQEVCQ